MLYLEVYLKDQQRPVHASGMCPISKPGCQAPPVDPIWYAVCL